MSIHINLSRYWLGERQKGDSEKVLALLSGTPFHEVTHLGIAHVRYPNEFDVQFIASDLRSHKTDGFGFCCFLTHGMNAELAKLIFEIADGGGMLIGTSWGEFFPTVTRPELTSHMSPEIFPSGSGPRVCPSLEDFVPVITQHVTEWRQWRDARIATFQERAARLDPCPVP